MKQFWQRIGNSEIRNILSIMVVLGCFIMLYVMSVKPMPSANKDILNIIAGMVYGGALSQVLGYYFGASKTNESDKIKTP